MDVRLICKNGGKHMYYSPEASALRKQLVNTDISEYSTDIASYERSLKLENLRSATLRNYLSYLRIFTAWLVLFCDAISYAQVSLDHVKSFIEFLRDRLSLAPNTINGYLAAIRKMFQYLRDEELSKRAIPDMIVDQHLPKVPTREQVVQMLKACVTIRERLLIGILITTGMRLNELISLKFSDIRTEMSMIYISADAKGRADGYVPLSKYIVKLLTRLCLEYNAAHPEAKLRPDDYIFFRPERDSHESAYQVRKTFIEIQKRAGLEEEHFRPHSMRHFFALQIYLQSKDLFLVKMLLRHRTLAATLKYLVMASSMDNEKKYANPGDLAFDEIDLGKDGNMK